MTMTNGQIDGHMLAERSLKGLNDHNPDAVDDFVAVEDVTTTRSWQTEVKPTAPGG
jgi:hypothetical protein